jgi:hypothetical protein
MTNVKQNSFIKSEGYMFRPQTVIIRPYNNLCQLVLCFVLVVCHFYSFTRILLVQLKKEVTHKKGRFSLCSLEGICGADIRIATLIFKINVRWR